MEKHVLRLTEEQEATGYQVVLAFNQGQRHGPDDIRMLPWLDLHWIPVAAIRDLIFYGALVAVLLRRRVRADAIHIHGDWSAFLFGRLVAWLTGATTIVASVHGAIRGGIWSRVYRLALRRYSVIYCTGAREANALRADGVRNVYWRSSGISDVYFREAEDDLSGEAKQIDVICVANLFPVKNLPLLMRIAQAMPDLMFVVVGEGPLRKTLEELAGDLALVNVRLAGALDVEGVRANLAGSRVFLSTSFVEGTPTAMLEAMAMGLPVVVSCSNDYSGVIVPGENGFVVDGWDPGLFSSAIDMVLADKATYRAISQRNREAARRHQWPYVANQISGWMEGARGDDGK